MSTLTVDIEARSGSIEVGGSTAIEMMRKALLDDHRVSYEQHEVEAAMVNAAGFLRYGLRQWSGVQV